MYHTLKKYKTIIERDVGLDWNFLSCVKTTERILELFWSKLNKSLVSIFQTDISEAFIISHIADFQNLMHYISYYHTLSRSFIDTNKAILNWGNLIKKQDICDPADMSLTVSCDVFIDKNELITYNKVTMSYLDTNYAVLDKKLMCERQTLSELFIDTHIPDFTNEHFKGMLVGGSIDTQTLVEKYISHIDVNVAIEFVQFDMAFLDLHYANIDKDKLIIYQPNITIDFLRTHQADFKWELISKHTKLTTDMMIEFIDRIYWDIASIYQIIANTFILNPEYFKYLNPKLLSKYQQLANDAMLRWGGSLDPHYMSIYQTIDAAILDSPLNYRMSFTNISVYQTVVEPELTTYTAKWNHNYLSEYQDVPIAYLLTNIDKFDNKYTLTKYHCNKFSEAYITDNLYRFDSNMLSKYRTTLSEVFIEQFKTVLNIDYILKYNTVITPAYKDILISWYMH